MDPNVILYPGIAMFFLTFAMVLYLGVARYSAVQRGDVSILAFRPGLTADAFRLTRSSSGRSSHTIGLLERPAAEKRPPMLGSEPCRTAAPRGGSSRHERHIGVARGFTSTLVDDRDGSLLPRHRGLSRSTRSLVR